MAHGGGGGMERRTFLAGLGVLAVPSAFNSGRGRVPSREVRLPAYGGFPRNDPERVQAVVGAAHFDLDRVRRLVEEQPALAKCSWDWGFGDWETPLGAASHTGRRAIAEFLIAQGARPTVFSAAMLGDVDTVRAFLAADPGLHRLPGPHGIPLLLHARAGGADAEIVVDYLLDAFGPGEGLSGFPGDEAVDARYGGRYRFESDAPVEIGVAVRNGFLVVGAGERPASRVLQVGEDVFHPTGAPAVRLRFDVVDGRASSLTVSDGPVERTGIRVAGS